MHKGVSLHYYGVQHITLLPNQFDHKLCILNCGYNSYGTWNYFVLLISSYVYWLIIDFISIHYHCCLYQKNRKKTKIKNPKKLSMNS